MLFILGWEVKPPISLSKYYRPIAQSGQSIALIKRGFSVRIRVGLPFKCVEVPSVSLYIYKGRNIRKSVYSELVGFSLRRVGSE